MTDTTNTGNEEFSSMTDEELQAQIKAMQAELGRRKWAKVDEVMTRIEALTDEELAELSNRVSSFKTARDRKVQEMTEGAKQANSGYSSIPQAPLEPVRPHDPAQFSANPDELLGRKPKKKFSEMTLEELSEVKLSELSQSEMNEYSMAGLRLQMRGMT
ncbi:hypothetical protein NDI52_30105 [Leptolyngbya sp. PL-A3]|uniref:hypothetical protein n=1 Tax=Leptolyngbya sp. PL-A3 TaxID=2933911 RepID=UPI0032994F3D